MSVQTTWLATREEDGWVQFRVGRRGAELIAEWVGLCTLVARADGSAWELIAEPDALPRDVDKVREGAARALVRSLDGKLALHGSSVAIGERALLLTGRHGAGKSTAAADLCLRGGALLADDITLLENDDEQAVLVLPSEQHHWLDESATRALSLSWHLDTTRLKNGHDAPAVAKRPTRLVGICELEWRATDAAPSPPLITRLTGLDALSALVPQVVRFVLDDPQARSRELNDLIDLASKVTVLRLSRDRGYDRSGEAWELLSRTLDLSARGPV